MATEDHAKHQDDIGKPELKHQSPTDAAPHDSAAGKTDIRHPADPATDPNPEGQDVSTTSGSGPTNKGDKLDGPGPRPLETVAKERGGDAGKVDQAPGAAVEDEDGPQKQSHGEGTGEKYVKSTGLAADGGDFDATKPGAGREADRKSAPPAESKQSNLAAEIISDTISQAFWRRKTLLSLRPGLLPRIPQVTTANPAAGKSALTAPRAAQRRRRRASATKSRQSCTGTNLRRSEFFLSALAT